MPADRSRRYLAEFLGTFALLFVGGGSAVFTLGYGAFEPAARVVIVSLTFGLVLAALAYLFGDISGGHFNPAVTVGMAVNGRLPWREVVPYVVTQVLGAITGIGVVAGIASGNSTFSPTAQASGLGSQCYAWTGTAPAGCGFSPEAVFLLEFALAFVFLLVILRTTRAESGAKNLAPLAIGFTLLVGNLLAIPVDGASMNPVRSFAPALVAAGWNWSSAGWALKESWIFWVAPIAGAIVAALVERWLSASTASTSN